MLFFYCQFLVDSQLRSDDPAMMPICLPLASIKHENKIKSEIKPKGTVYILLMFLLNFVMFFK